MPAPAHNTHAVADGLYVPQQSFFLSLTPELRNRIYEYIFTINAADDTVNFVNRTRLSGLRPSVLSLLQTCHQVLDEAEGLFYHLNHLRLTPLQGGMPTIRSKARMESLNVVTVHAQHPEDITAAVKWLRGATSLRVLKIDLRPYHTTPNLRKQFQVEWPFLQRTLPRIGFVDEFEIAVDESAIVYSAALCEEVKKWEEKIRGRISRAGNSVSARDVAPDDDLVLG